MEFVITVLALFAGSDDSWQMRARSFLFTDAPAIRWRSRAACKIGEELRLTLIAIFGAVGTLARYGLQGLVQIRIGSTFPYGTLLINLTGCFFFGLIGQFTLNRIVIFPDLGVGIAVGFFCGLTTLSR